MGESHLCRFCVTVIKVTEHTKLMGTGDMVPPGFEVEPPTPDDACPD